MAFTGQVKPVEVKRRNTPSGASKPSAKFLKHYDPRQKLLDQKGPPIQADLSRIIPKEILLGHAVNITRRHMALRPDHLVRDIPTIESPKRSQRASPRRAPDGLTLVEKKLWKKMDWYKLDSL